MNNKELEVNDIQETKRAEVLFERISTLIEQSRQFVANAVNIAEVKTRYEVGRYIFEDEQQGERAAYGKQILKNLSARLIERFGNDWSYDTLKRCRFFYQAYEKAAIGATPLPQLGKSLKGDEYDERSFYVNLVFYNRLLQSYVLIDLKTGDLTHQDLGQMQMYVNYYDRYVKQDFEKPTIGVLLCQEKSDALVELTLPKDSNIYASQYSLYLPDKALLQKS